MAKRILGSILFAWALIPALAQPNKGEWIDSVFSSLSTSDKIGQLFMHTIDNARDENQVRAVMNFIKSNDAGGVVFTGDADPLLLAKTIRALQDATDIPLLTSIDARGQLYPRFDSAAVSQPALLAGAIRSDSLLRHFALTIARQMNMVGLHMNFMTLTAGDVAPQKPFMNMNTWADDNIRMAAHARLFVEAMNTQNILTCAQYVPLKGITVTDVQKGMPVVSPGLDSLQAYAHLKLFGNGLAAFVPATAQFPLFYQSSNLAKRNPYNAGILSALFTGEWLRQQQQFGGLAIADLRRVQATEQDLKEGDLEVLAFLAGNDMILNPKEMSAALRRLRRLVRKDDRYARQLDASVRRILAAKYDAGLWKKPSTTTDKLLARLNTTEERLFSKVLDQSAITVLRNQGDVLPFTALENKRFAYLTPTASDASQEFYRYLSHYVAAYRLTLDANTTADALRTALNGRETIIVSIFPGTPPAVTDNLRQLVAALGPNHTFVVCDFGNEYMLKNAGDFPVVLTTYTSASDMAAMVPQVLFGGLKANGVLPFTASPQLSEGSGLVVNSLGRLAYALPEDAGMDTQVLSRIDDIVNEATKNLATPGCQVLVARHGKVVFDKSYGYEAYDAQAPVTEQTIYDLASLTKVSATLQAVMFMHEKGLIDIYKKASVYLPELRNSNKKDITIIDMLTHQAGLVPFIPLWPQTVKDTVFLPEYYSRTRSAAYPLRVAPGLYASVAMRDSVWSWVIKSKMAEKPPRTPYPYRYSDLGFMILQHLAERILNQPLDDFLAQNFYEPLGAYTTGFNPLDRFSDQRIAPTENDTIYRKSLIVGTVHDERAAMLGGVSGHAGLFSTANDLAKLAQMLLQEGQYGGYQYYKPETVRLFRAKQFDKSRRGLGWDKPVQSDWNSPTSLLASPQTFGHTGFTGTCLWVDPEFDLVYIFLSNRVFPDRNTKLLNTNIRTRIQDVIYQSIFSYCGQSQ